MADVLLLVLLLDVGHEGTHVHVGQGQVLGPRVQEDTVTGEPQQRHPTQVRSVRVGVSHRRHAR